MRQLRTLLWGVATLVFGIGCVISPMRAARYAAQAASASEPWGRYLAVSFTQANAPRVRWANTPGHAQDWVTVVPTGTPDNQWGTWTYLQSRTAGEFQAPPLAPGQYEARLYFNWPAGGFVVQERVPFSVGAGHAQAVEPPPPAYAPPPPSPPPGRYNPEPVAPPAPPPGNYNAPPPSPASGRYLSVGSAYFASGQAVTLQWFNTPGHDQDWVTVVPSGTPDNEWGTWTYLHRNTSGQFAVGSPRPGDYEARLYFNWPAGGFVVQERIRFSVR